MKIVSSEQMRELDRKTIEDAGVPGEVFMERAGAGAARAVLDLCVLSPSASPSVLLLAGKGNNGGDAFVVARHLLEAGCHVRVWLAGKLSDVKGDALMHLQRLKEEGLTVHEKSTAKAWDEVLEQPVHADIVVDGLLGTGASGAPKGVAAKAILFVNKMAATSLCVALDLPSGLDADSGETPGETVVADLTVTMGLPKNGLIEEAGRNHVGSLEVVDIGIPQKFIDSAKAANEELELIARDEVRLLLGRRDRNAHKGKFGHILLLGGARGYTGAITLAARAALRSGAGLVTVFVPASIEQPVAANVPEAMIRGVAETSEGSLSSDILPDLESVYEEFDALLVGPGLTRSHDSLLIARQLIRDCRAPLVMDADAISVLEGQPHWIEKADVPVVITPHPGELATLFGQDVAEVQADRLGIAQAAAKFTDATVVLKGAGTLVAHSDHTTNINLTGNPGMATGGSGDVLAGMIVALIGQGINAFDAAKAAVYLHGRAGDLAAWNTSQAGIIASDLIEALPYAIREVAGR